MSLNEMIALAAKIVKREQVTMPIMEGWELSELLWWIDNAGKDLI